MVTLGVALALLSCRSNYFAKEIVNLCGALLLFCIYNQNLVIFLINLHALNFHIYQIKLFCRYFSKNWPSILVSRCFVKHILMEISKSLPVFLEGKLLNKYSILFSLVYKTFRKMEQLSKRTSCSSPVTQNLQKSAHITDLHITDIAMLLILIISQICNTYPNF